MLILSQVSNLVIQQFLRCLIDEMKEKAKHEKLKDQFAIQTRKDLFAEVICSISKISLLTLPYHSLLIPKKKEKKKKRERNPLRSVVCIV